MLRAYSLIPIVGLSLIPAACGGDSNNDVAAITDPEGGNILFEYIYFDTDLQTVLGVPATINRVMAYFMTAQTPEDNPLPAPGACTNLEATHGWPLFVGSPHTDVDVGTLTMHGVNAAGTSVSIDVPKQAAGLDNIGRMHDIFYQTITPNGNDTLKFNTSYDVEFGGAGDIPATTFTDGVFLPADFTVNTPDLDDDGPLTADTTVHWTPATSTLPDTPNYAGGHAGVAGLVLLVDTNGSPTHLCLTDHSTGEFTIPGTAIEEYKAVATARGTDPTHVILLRQALVHILNRLPGTDRRIDMLGITCWAQFMGLQ